MTCPASPVRTGRRFPPVPPRPARSRSAQRHAAAAAFARPDARLVALLGPAFVAAVAYVDPGNFATNFSAGAKFGYALIWVIVAANLMAMLVQYLSAKTGVATGKDLPELCREHLPRPVSRGLWVQAEIVAMATDLAEFVGAAIGLNLLFGVPLFPAGADHRGRGVRRSWRWSSAATGASSWRSPPCSASSLLGFAYDLVAVGADAGGVAAGLVPSFGGGDSVLLAAGIIGATVMPHVVYLHSALTKPPGRRAATTAERRELLRFQRLDVVVGLGIAGLINLSMLVVAASLFHGGAVGGRRLDRGARTPGSAELVGGGAALAVRRRAARLRASLVQRRDVRRPGRHAGLHAPADPAAPPPRRVTMLPALVVLGARASPDPTPGDLPGRAVVRHPVRARAAWLLTRRADVMGPLRQPARHDRRRRRRRGGCHRAQPVPAVGDIPLRE